MKVILVMVTTADGKIAKDKEHVADWTSKEDKKFFVEKTKECKVMIMGMTTYQTIGRPLPGRLTIVYTRNPNAEGLEQQPGVLEYTNLGPKELLAQLEKRGFDQVALVGGGTINAMFLRERLIDDLYLSIEPYIFGAGLGVFSEAPADVNLELIDVSKLSEQVVLLHYKLKK
jgi:dihydrofolate reductase